MFNFMRILLAGLVLFSSGSFAANEGWYSNDHFLTPTEACNAWLSEYSYPIKF